MNQPHSLTDAEATEFVRRHRGRIYGVAITLLALAAVFYGLALVRL
ncbi:conserved hypothetical protein [Gluconacetobacter diazotrophicus PA1 5]|uniref:Uncharacterized protein n=2 Tax=Gluconacetobacter diazotrophicus TaxID=33996 RepID=A0A7W4I3N7_GLUDI|nr:hypothetical protein [Gluconacetobacter diazotrophicus]ACI50114.1 conserved hypothetical protein [Gluconacetobacter diazotrophicus PA1 5]MBB2154966.1 hypothetical protein [Gluconacetobacter diazotrophicus]TWB08127.1 hypothetical protein FBZ86_108147 [Gluconacetobacter diazotrophicus]CAP56042.1 putative membrane protein [Gluconacetobacter diazotrophicus PA1 5]